jgi:hypothetical protein
VNESSQSAAAPGAAPLGLPELPEGWRSAECHECDEWPDPYVTRRRRWLAVRVGFWALFAACLAGALVWVAAGHYSRGIAALDDRAYGLAMSELSAARVLVFPYRDAEALEEQARQALHAETAAFEREEARSTSVIGRLAAAGDRLFDGGDAAGVLAALEAIPTPVLRSTLASSDAAGEAAAALMEDLQVAATTALRKAEWQRAGKFAAAMLVLEPSGAKAPALAERARVGEKLAGQLAAAKEAARQGKWRDALRMALAVVAVRKDFPGAAALVADARAALAPKPKPRPTPAAAATSTPTDTGGGTTTTPTLPPPP